MSDSNFLYTIKFMKLQKVLGQFQVGNHGDMLKILRGKLFLRTLLQLEKLKVLEREISSDA